MANNKTISFLLGSGFSKPAGLADASEINNILKNFSINNFKNNFEGIDFCFEYGEIVLFRLIIEKFINKNHYFDYEEFYDFFFDKIENTDNRIKLIKESFSIENVLLSKCNLKIEDELLYSRNSNYFTKIDELFNLTLFSILSLKDASFTKYDSFTNSIINISKDNLINMFTLNHDLLVETIFENKVVFSNGFIENLDKIKVYKDIFDPKFNVNLFKLHGSLNWFFNEKKEHILIGRNKTIFEKLEDELFISTILEQYKNNLISESLSPLFLTGKMVKTGNISKNYQLSQLLLKFKENIGKSQEVIIIGYSYRDEYINFILQSEIEKSITIKRIININPKEEFPYSFNNCVVYNYKGNDWLEKFPLIANCS